MKKTYFTLIALCLSFCASGQIWVDNNATWHYDWSGTLPAFDKIEYVGDTLIHEKTSQKYRVTSYIFSPIEEGAELVQTWENYRYTRLDGDTVFYLVDDTFHVLYNFGAQVGDSWNLGVDSNGFGCGISQVKVVSKGSSQINGQDYEWIGLETLPNSSVGIDGIVYKRFGTVGDYLFPYIRICDLSKGRHMGGYSFSCFEDDSFPLYNVTGNDCDYPLHVGISEPLLPGSILRISPNPVLDILTVEIMQPGFKAQSLRITDMQGRLLLTAKGLRVDVSQLPPGIYILHADLNENRSAAVKFFKK